MTRCVNMFREVLVWRHANFASYSLSRILFTPPPLSLCIGYEAPIASP